MGNLLIARVENRPYRSLRGLVEQHREGRRTRRALAHYSPFRLRDVNNGRDVARTKSIVNHAAQPAPTIEGFEKL
jgi:uncharacterized protein YjiS (DUF1127 family)